MIDMLNESVVALGKKRSTIRELFEFGNQRAVVTVCRKP